MSLHRIPLLAVAVAGMVLMAAVRADTVPQPNVGVEDANAVAERCLLLEAVGGWCVCRTRADMAKSYSAGLLSMTSRQLVGFKSNWDRNTRESFRTNDALRNGSRWMDAFLNQYVGGPHSRITALHLDMNRGTVWVLPDPNMTGSMIMHPAQSEEFVIAAELFDQYVCTSNKSSVASNVVNLAGHHDLLAALERVGGLFVDPDVATQVQIAHWAALADADKATVASFQSSEPQDYEKAVVGRALFVDSAVEAIKAWSSPEDVQAGALQELGLVGIKRKPPTEAAQKEFQYLVNGFLQSPAGSTPSVETLSAESKDLLQMFVGKSQQAATSTSIDAGVVWTAIENQVEQHPYLTLPIEATAPH